MTAFLTCVLHNHLEGLRVQGLDAASRGSMCGLQTLWKAGTMARRRGFQVSRSAGMRPLPMMGSRISASTPLS